MWLGSPLAESPFGDIEVGEISDVPFVAFLQDSRQRGRFLIEVTATELESGYLGFPEDEPIGAMAFCEIPGGELTLGEATFRLSDGPWIGRPGDTLRPNTLYDARVISSADIERTLPLSPEANRRGETTVGEIQLANPDGALDDFISNYSIGGRPVSVYLGPSRGVFSDFRLVAQMFGLGFETDLNTVRLRVQSTAEYLKQPFHTRRYSGLGGRDGDPEIAERAVPVLYGECYNVSPVLINRDQWIYAVHDGPILAFDAIKERGLPLDFNGTDAASWTALRATTVDLGEYATCNAEGMVKIGFGVGGPTGPVTCDVRGDKASSIYSAQIGEILLRLATNRARMDITLLDQIGFGNLPTGDVGYYSSGDTEPTVADVYDAMLRSINGWYGTKRNNVLRVGYVSPPERYTAGRSYDRHGAINLEEVPTEQPPRYEQTVTYAKNWTVMSEGDISEALTSEERLRLQLGSSTLRKRSAEVRVRDLTAIIGDPIETFFVNEPDAQDVLDRVMALFRESRRKFRMTTDRQGYLDDLQAIVSLSYPRLGLSAGQNFLVAAVRDDGRRGRVELTLWG